jgi:hypothetical protein
VGVLHLLSEHETDVLILNTATFMYLWYILSDVCILNTGSFISLFNARLNVLKAIRV